MERVDEQDDVLGVADRAEAARRGWLHRVATSICRDEEGRILVFRRSDRADRFPGYYDVTVGGAVTPGESYEQAAARGLAEQLGARVPVRPVVRFLCRGVSGSYWLGGARGRPGGGAAARPRAGAVARVDERGRAAAGRLALAVHPPTARTPSPAISP
ncbi:NUDIX domain-containing protein [Nonomuraea ferruginea]